MLASMRLSEMVWRGMLQDNEENDKLKNTSRRVSNCILMPFLSYLGLCIDILRCHQSCTA